MKKTLAFLVLLCLLTSCTTVVAQQAEDDLSWVVLNNFQLRYLSDYEVHLLAPEDYSLTALGYLPDQAIEYANLEPFVYITFPNGDLEMILHLQLSLILPLDYPATQTVAFIVDGTPYFFDAIESVPNVIYEDDTRIESHVLYCGYNTIALLRAMAASSEPLYITIDSGDDVDLNYFLIFPEAMGLISALTEFCVESGNLTEHLLQTFDLYCTLLTEEPVH